MKNSILFLISCFILCSVFGQTSSLNPAFGNGGVVTINLNPNLDNEVAIKVAQQPDGKLVLLFKARDQFWMTRYLSDGELEGFPVYDYFSYGDFYPNDITALKDGRTLLVGYKIDYTTGYKPAFSILTVDENPITTHIISGQNDSATAVAIQSDGKIVVVGTTFRGTQHDFAIVRYNTDGSLDSSFSSNGKDTLDFNSGDDLATAVAIQADGKIVVGGYTGGSNKDFALVRYNANGTRDLSFANHGKRITAFYGGVDILKSLAIQPDGKILAAGTTRSTKGTDFALVRYNKNGSVDLTFKGTGQLTIDLSAGSEDVLQSIAVQTDSKILIGGYTKTTKGYDFALLRYLSNGVPDSSFAGNGKNIIDLGTPGDIASQMILQQNGKAVMIGSMANATTDMVLTRFNSDGKFDSFFNGNGKVVDFLRGPCLYNAIALQSDGKILVGGSANDVDIYNGHNYAALSRYLSDGRLDSTFSGDGIIIANNNFSLAHSIAFIGFQKDNKIVTAGYNDPEIEVSRFKSDGTYDSSFGNKGTVKTNFSEESYNPASASALVIQPDGKIVVAGNVGDEGRMTVIRYLSNGSFDSSFGIAGIVLINIGYQNDNYDPLKGMTLQPDGKIILVGKAYNNDFILNDLVIRLNPNGSLDGSFGVGGIKIVDLSLEYSSANTVSLQKDGKILVGGAPNFTIARLNTNGSLDTTFSGYGWVTNNIGDEVKTLVIQPDGRILVGGAKGSNIALARYYSNGKLDATFPSKGQQISGIADSNFELRSLLLAGDHFYAAGVSNGNRTLAAITSNTFDRGQLTYYRDADSDGYGNPAIHILANSKPSGYIENNTDCNDNDKNFHPNAPELCDGKDNNCNGVIDEGLTQITFYRDLDKDGYGSPAVTIKACAAPAGYVSNNQDCFDGDAAIHPGATELCNGLDDNCNGQIDEGLAIHTFYRDNDRDGYGNPKVFKVACAVPPGYVSDNTDCNDLNSSVHPGAVEIPNNGIDDNCNGVVDETTAPVAQTGTVKEQSTNSHDLQVSVSPNPSAHYFTLFVKSGDQAPINIKVIDELGRIVEQKRGLLSTGNVLLGQSYKQGIYYAEITQGNKRLMIKLIKETN